MNNVIGIQNSLESISIVLKSIIRSKNFDTFGKLSFNRFCKIRIYLQYFRTMFYMKNPAIARVIINKDNKILETKEDPLTSERIRSKISVDIDSLVLKGKAGCFPN